MGRWGRWGARWGLLGCAPRTAPSPLDARLAAPTPRPPDSCQARFSAEGFASTVWDSAIVCAKLFEKQGAARWAGKRALDLSAGCGLPGLVLAKLGAAVTATDLGPNLPLLRKNAEANGARRRCWRGACCRHGGAAAAAMRDEPPAAAH